MEVVGQSIKSFKESPLTQKIIEVVNYPLRKRSKEELIKIQKIKRLRGVEVKVNDIFQQGEIGADDNELEKTSHEKKTAFAFEASAENTKLLLHPFDINSDEKRRVQSIILSECVLDIKVQLI